MTLDFNQFKPKKPNPSHEWMIGYSDGVKYITDGTILLNWDNCPSPDPLLANLVTDTHKEDNSGVEASYKKGVVFAMDNYPQCARLFPQECEHVWEDTGIIFDNQPRGGLQRVFYNQEIGYQYLNLDFLKNLFYLAGFKTESQYKAVTITSAKPLGPMCLSLSGRVFGLVMPIKRKNNSHLRLSQDHLGGTVYVVERLNNTKPPSRVSDEYFTNTGDARQYVNHRFNPMGGGELIMRHPDTPTEPTRVKVESTGEEYLITPLKRNW